MSGIKHKIAIMSCKGGVGKSTFAANLATALAQRGKTTAILDCDFHGPCIPKILGVEGKGLKIGKEGIVPVSGPSKVGVISMAFLLPKCSSKKLVVETGHTSEHAPHPLHSSVVYRGFLSIVTL